MGNEASSVVAAASATHKFNQGMSSINKKLDGTAKNPNDGMAGCATRKESKARTKEREKEYAERKKEREERTKKLGAQWAEHRSINSAPPDKKKWFG
jgi:hypothetical protein